MIKTLIKLLKDKDLCYDNPCLLMLMTIEDLRFTQKSFINAIIIGSPLYYGFATGDVRAFMERLMFPIDTYEIDGDGKRPIKLDRIIPTAMIYTMNAGGLPEKNQLNMNEDDLQCWIKDDVTQLLKDTYHADGIVFASPVYYMNMSAQLRLFWERLQYPGPLAKTISTAIIYTMNANEEQCEKLMSPALNINS